MSDPRSSRASVDDPAPRGPSPGPLGALARDARGSVFVEYVIVTAFAGLLVALGLLTVGPKAVRNYSNQRATLYQSNP